MGYGKNPVGNQEEAVMLDPNGGTSNGHGEPRVSCKVAGGAWESSDCFHLLCSVRLIFCLRVMCFPLAHSLFLRKHRVATNQYKTE